MESLWIAKTGLEAQQTRMSVVSQNLANINTTGYKRQRAMFEDLLYQNVVQTGGLTSQQTESPTGLNIGTGVHVVAVDRQFQQGNIVTTENPLDLSIQGRGFFEILLPDGSQAYTRDGTFQLDADGQLVTSAGFTMQPAITIPASAVRDGNAVFLKAGDKAVRRSVTVGRTTSRGVEVTDGLSGGEDLIVNPPPELADGSTIRVKTS